MLMRVKTLDAKVTHGSVVKVACYSLFLEQKLHLCIACGQESESAEIGFLWGPKHEQFSMHLEVP